MRALLVPVAVAASLSLAPAAFAATKSASGAIKAYDAKAHSLTLSDGTTYMLPAKLKTPGLKVGEKVQISFDTKAGAHNATAVKVLK